MECEEKGDLKKLIGQHFPTEDALAETAPPASAGLPAKPPPTPPPPPPRCAPPHLLPLRLCPAFAWRASERPTGPSRLPPPPVAVRAASRQAEPNPQRTAPAVRRRGVRGSRFALFSLRWCKRRCKLPAASLHLLCRL
jgi:hypothetical protein